MTKRQKAEKIVEQFGDCSGVICDINGDECICPCYSMCEDKESTEIMDDAIQWLKDNPEPTENTDLYKTVRGLVREFLCEQWPEVNISQVLPDKEPELSEEAEKLFEDISKTLGQKKNKGESEMKQEIIKDTRTPDRRIMTLEEVGKKVNSFKVACKDNRDGSKGVLVGGSVYGYYHPNGDSEKRYLGWWGCLNDIFNGDYSFYIFDHSDECLSFLMEEDLK